MSFLVLSLPRSRSAWLSHFLTMGGQFLVGHDLILDCDSVEDFQNFFSPSYLPKPFTGSCETGAVLGWRLIRELMPQAKILVLQRPVGEVMASLEAWIGPGTFDPQVMLEREAMLQACAASPGVEAIQMGDLDDPDCLKWILHYLLGGEASWDLEWWMALRGMNIQVNPKVRMERIWERKEALEGLTAEVARRTLELSAEGMQ